MKITCTADLHGHFPKLPGGDLLIVAGDLTAKHTQDEFDYFLEYLCEQQYERMIFIAGNHDTFFEEDEQTYVGSLISLFDSGVDVDGWKIWGSPWSLKFKGINPKCCAYTAINEDQLNDQWRLIPDDTEILITHMPPYGILDGVPNFYDGTLFHCGSTSLLARIKELKNLKLHVFGHIHEGFGMVDDRQAPGVQFVNASYVNQAYKPVNFPIEINLERK